MIFPNIIREETLQVDDRTRIDARKSFITEDEAAITLVEIEPEASGGFIDVTSKKYLDWQYDSEGDKVATVRITTDGSPTAQTATITVVTAASDALFSSDAELVVNESEIMNFTRNGRNSFLDKHREAQSLIVNYLDHNRIWDSTGERLTKSAIVDVDEVREWSKYLTLQLIFEDLSNQIGDIFDKKAAKYRAMAERESERSVLRLDTDGDSTTDYKKFTTGVRVTRR